MHFTNTEQLREIFLSCGMGFLLGVMEDVFRLMRRYLTPPKFVVFLLDIICGAVSAVAVFLFCLAVTQGRVRFYTLLAVSCGFLAYRLTVGRMTTRLTDAIFQALKRTGDCCERFLDRGICLFRQWFGNASRKLSEKGEKMRKKAKKFSKKGCNHGL